MQTSAYNINDPFFLVIKKDEMISFIEAVTGK